MEETPTTLEELAAELVSLKTMISETKPTTIQGRIVDWVIKQGTQTVLLVALSGWLLWSAEAAWNHNEMRMDKQLERHTQEIERRDKLIQQLMDLKGVTAAYDQAGGVTFWETATGRELPDEG